MFIKKQISVIIPVYNEQESVSDTVLKTIKILEKDFEHYELIVVDDGSTDKTAEILKNISNSNLIVLTHKENQNYAKSLIDGFKISTGEYVSYNSADLPLNPEEFKNIIDKSMPFDLVVLERNKYSGASVWRKIISICNRIILHIFYPLALIDIADANYTAIIKRNILNDILPVLRSPGFVLAEMIIKAKYLKYNIKTITADYNKRIRGEAHFGYIKDIMWSLFDIIYFRIYSVFWKLKIK